MNEVFIHGPRGSGKSTELINKWRDSDADGLLVVTTQAKMQNLTSIITADCKAIHDSSEVRRFRSPTGRALYIACINSIRQFERIYFGYLAGWRFCWVGIDDVIDYDTPTIYRTVSNLSRGSMFSTATPRKEYSWVQGWLLDNPQVEALKLELLYRHCTP